MKRAIVILLAAAGWSAGRASAQERPSQPAVAPLAAEAQTSAPATGRSEADQAVERIRENLRRSAATSNPFPYADAIDPPREPYRRPVPCGTFARETDGTTTCIGTQERTSVKPRMAARAVPKRPARAHAHVRPRPVVRMPVAGRLQLTRGQGGRPHVQAQARVQAQPRIESSDGLLAFLGRILSR